MESVQHFILLSLCLLYLIRRIRRQWKSKILNINGGMLLHRPSSSYRKLLDRVTFRILSKINDGAPLRKYVMRLYGIRLMLVVLMVFFTCGELVLVLREVCPILRNGYGI